MGDAAINDVRLGDAGAECGNASLDLGQHSAADDALADHFVDLIEVNAADQTFGVVGVAADAVRI